MAQILHITNFGEVDRPELCRKAAGTALSWANYALNSIAEGQSELAPRRRRSPFEEGDRMMLIGIFEDAAEQARSAVYICERISELIREAK
jgi:hypothetical protein